MTQTTPMAHADIWKRLRNEADPRARQELVEAYARLVKYVAGRMAIGLPNYVEHGDLNAAGLLGLIQAIDNFDETRGIKFETYAIPRIRGAILDELRSQDWIPRSLRRKAKQLEAAYAAIESRCARPSAASSWAAKATARGPAASTRRWRRCSLASGRCSPNPSPASTWRT